MLSEAAWAMDDSHPVASYLQTFFGDEDDDGIAVLELSRQLGRHPIRAREVRDAWADVLARRDTEAARALVEDFANRDMTGSGARALDWLSAIYQRLEPLWQSIDPPR